MKNLTAILLFMLALTTIVAAQQTQSGGTKVAAELFAASSTAVVKGEPYSAEAVSESVQMLADGNKISRSNATRMFRDSEGRTRRENVSSSGGNNGFGYSYSTAPDSGFTFFGSQNTISIFDSVSNVRYSLNPTAKTARRMKSQFPIAEYAQFAANAQSISSAPKAQSETNAAKKVQAVALPGLAPLSIGDVNAAATLVIGRASRAGKTESLGTRDIEGVTAEGTRSITTIPAGAIGNERPIEIVYERWYSKELQLIVLSKHTDPRFGEQTYRLTNINRSEPDRALFTPPADYKIVSESSLNYFTTKPREEK
jgi:hypothetical protein